MTPFTPLATSGLSKRYSGRWMKYISILAGIVFCASVDVHGHGAELPAGFVEELIADGLNPTSMCISRDGRIFLAQKDGRILVISEHEGLHATPVVTLATDVTNERGLQGIQLHPDFPDSSYLYAYYALKDRPVNRVSRLTLLGDLVIPGSELILLETDPLPGTVHNGGALAFGPVDGMLYISVGDGGKSVNGQDTSKLLGKILRIHAYGGIPATNPFYDQYEGVLKSIFATGFRNPFSMTFSQENGQLFVCDVGSGFFEEINIVHAGKNYGWPLVEGFLTTQNPPANYQDPFFAYPHSQGCAIVGASFYQPAEPEFPDSLLHHFFFGDYCNGTIYHIDPNGTGATSGIFATEVHRPLAMAVAPDGSFYYIAREGEGGGSQGDNTVSTDGTLWKVNYTGNGIPHISASPEDLFLPVGEEAVFQCTATGNEPLSFNWYLNGQVQPDEHEETLTIDAVDLSMDGWTVYCIVSNELGQDTSGTAILEVTSNHRPDLYIDFPVTGMVYQAGDTLKFAGHGFDQEDGLLPMSHFQWRVDFHHKSHVHPALESLTGTNFGAYIIPTVNETDPEVWYRIHFTATDSEGLAAAVFVDVLPDLASITLTGPEGMPVNVDGIIATLPATITGVKKLRHTILADAEAQLGDTMFLWQGYDHRPSARLLEFNAPVKDTIIHLGYWGIALGNGTGLLGEYFDDPESDMDGEPQVILYDSTVHFSWGAGSPVENFPKDYFTARWTGWVTPYLDGDWTFYVRSDDGCRLWVDDMLVIDEWHGQPPTTYYASLSLEGGKNYQIRLEYMEKEGGAEVHLSWSHDAIPEEIIPKSQLIAARLVANGSIEGSLWVDENGNTLQDTAEHSVDQATVLLYHYADTSWYKAVDAEKGLFRFDHVKEGLYLIQVVYTGSDDLLVPAHGLDAAGFSAPFFVQGNFVHQQEYAFARKKGHVSGRVWEDENANGFPEDHEPGVSEILCIIHNMEDGTFQITQTDAEGHFTIEQGQPALLRIELANKPGINLYEAGTGLNEDFSTSSFYHDGFSDLYYLFGLVPVSSAVDESGEESERVFPNPTVSFIHVPVDREDTRIFIWDAFGRVWKSASLEHEENIFQLDIGELPAGVLTVGIQKRSGIMEMYKVIKN